ncbi:MAG TPA: hypothetical protein VJW17_02305 [Pyrinomonadaceae bacterium]|nr:hypothetical protein [Pyrinomonadaceae bacterium]
MLTSLLKRTGTRLSWQLLYDPGLKVYALNIHGVPEIGNSKDE